MTAPAVPPITSPDTKKEELEVACPNGVATVICPVAAFAGTCTISVQGSVDDTVAGVPPIVTWFWFGVALNPMPKISTLPPGALPGGSKAKIVTDPDGLWRRIERIFPTAS